MISRKQKWYSHRSYRHTTSYSIRFLRVNADEKLPFPDDYFDIVYTKKGPWLYQEANRITKPGGIVMGLYHGGTDGGLWELFPGLYHPIPINPFDLELIEKKYKFKESVGLIDFNIEVIEEIENQTVKEAVWRECFKEVEEIFNKQTTVKGLKVINYHHIITARATCL